MAKLRFDVDLGRSTSQVMTTAEDTMRPPVLHDLASALQQPPRVLEKNLKECQKAGLVLRPVPNRFYLPDGINQLKKALTDANQGAPFTVKQYRDTTNIGRNLCIEILEYFDRTKVTRRLGDLREILES